MWNGVDCSDKTVLGCHLTSFVIISDTSIQNTKSRFMKSSVIHSHNDKLYINKKIHVLVSVNCLALMETFLSLTFDNNYQALDNNHQALDNTVHGHALHNANNIENLLEAEKANLNASKAFVRFYHFKYNKK